MSTGKRCDVRNSSLLRANRFLGLGIRRAADCMCERLRCDRGATGIISSSSDSERVAVVPGEPGGIARAVAEGVGLRVHYPDVRHLPRLHKCLGWGPVVWSLRCSMTVSTSEPAPPSSRAATPRSPDGQPHHGHRTAEGNGSFPGGMTFRAPRRAGSPDRPCFGVSPAVHWVSTSRGAAHARQRLAKQRADPCDADDPPASDLSSAAYLDMGRGCSCLPGCTMACLRRVSLSPVCSGLPLLRWVGSRPGCAWRCSGPCAAVGSAASSKATCSGSSPSSARISMRGLPSVWSARSTKR